MRSGAIFLVMLLLVPPGRAMGVVQQPSSIYLRDAFGVELPEIGTGILEASRASDIPEIFLPASPMVTMIRVWLLAPYSERVDYSGITLQLNGKTLGLATRKETTIDGRYLEVDLRSYPSISLVSGKNVLDVQAVERDGGRTLRCSFVLLSSDEARWMWHPGDPMSQIRQESIVATGSIDQPSIDQTPPVLKIVEPLSAIDGLSGRDLTVRLQGEVKDESGLPVTMTVNGVAMAFPVPPEAGAKQKQKKGRNNTAPSSPAPAVRTFDQQVTVREGERALMVEALDRAGNRSLVTVPVFRPVPVSPPRGRRFALVVGVSQYLYNEGGLNNLGYADDDARAIEGWLRQPGNRFRPDEIVLLVDDRATLSAVRGVVERFLSAAGDNDQIFLFISGHGAADKYDPTNLYFLLHDSRVVDMDKSGLSMKWLGGFLSEKRSRAQLVAFLDTCHSAGIQTVAQEKPAPVPLPVGSAPVAPGKKAPTRAPAAAGKKKPSVAPAGPGNQGRGVGGTTQPTATPPAIPATDFNFYNEGLVRGNQWTIISSAARNQLSFEDRRWGGGHGVFTYSLLEGLGGKADENGDCLVTTAELSRHLRKQVSEETKGDQTPQVLLGSRGEQILTRVEGCSNSRR